MPNVRPGDEEDAHVQPAASGLESRDLRQLIHDLRNPLSVALLNVQMARLGADASGDEWAESLELAESELRRMAQLLIVFASSTEDEDNT